MDTMNREIGESAANTEAMMTLPSADEHTKPAAIGPLKKGLTEADIAQAAEYALSVSAMLNDIKNFTKEKALDELKKMSFDPRNALRRDALTDHLIKLRQKEREEQE